MVSFFRSKTLPDGRTDGRLGEPGRNAVSAHATARSTNRPTTPTTPSSPTARRSRRRSTSPTPSPERRIASWTDAAGRPFFLYVSYSAVHSPMQALPADYETFRRHRDPQRRVFGGMLKALDESVGALRILELEERGLTGEHARPVPLRQRRPHAGTDQHEPPPAGPEGQPVRRRHPGADARRLARRAAGRDGRSRAGDEPRPDRHRPRRRRRVRPATVGRRSNLLPRITVRRAASGPPATFDWRMGDKAALRIRRPEDRPARRRGATGNSTTSPPTPRRAATSPRTGRRISPGCSPCGRSGKRRWSNRTRPTPTAVEPSTFRTLLNRTRTKARGRSPNLGS